MKLAPATHSPAHPARTYPVLMASSVDVGPGMRFAAPSMSRNCWRVIHFRRWTTSDSIRAICAAGPPKLIVPNFRNKKESSSNLSVNECPCGCGEIGSSLLKRDASGWICQQTLRVQMIVPAVRPFYERYLIVASTSSAVGLYGSPGASYSIEQ